MSSGSRQRRASSEQVLTRALCFPSSYKSCVQRSTFRQAFSPELTVPPCIERYILCQEPRLEKSAPVLRQAFRPSKSAQSSVERSVLTRTTYAQRASIILIRVFRPRDTGKRRTSVGQRRATNVLSSVKRSVLRRAFRPLSIAPSSVE